MALSLDDRLLGEKVQCYISDDEDEGPAKNGDVPLKNVATQQHNPQAPQTGPKGVINDYKEFQKTGSTPGQITPTDVETDEHSDLSDLDDDEAFEEYRQQRLNEMLLTQAVITTTETRSKAIYDLDADNYVEQQESSGNVVTLLYDSADQNSRVMQKAITHLAKQLPHVKFCRAERRILSTQANMDLLSQRGLPCLIGNYDGIQVGAIVWPEIVNELGEEFLPEHLFSLLRERDFL